MDRLLIGLSVVGLLAAICLILYDARRRQHEALEMKRMRMSALYADLYGIIESAREHAVDEVRVEHNRLLLTAVFPSGKLAEYVFSANNHRYLSATRTRALMHALTQDIPGLQKPDQYKMTRYYTRRPNGQRDEAYLFTIRSDYKTRLIRAPYYDGRLQSQLW